MVTIEYPNLEDLLKFSKLLLVIFTFSYSSFSFCQINLNVTINQLIGSEKIQTIKQIKSEFDKDIIIIHEGFKNKIVINLKKVPQISVNGSLVSPIQIDLKLIDEAKKIIGKPQTITTFYTNSANFYIPGTDKKLNLSLNFKEI